MKRDLEGKKVAVVGMARSGIAAAELLRRHGAIVTAIDSRPAAEFDQAEFPVLPQTPESFAGAGLIVLSPGVPLDAPELERSRRQGIPIIGEVELASWFLRGPIIGITGANGKTTTTAMIGHILRESGLFAEVGGNIGMPPAAMVNSSSDSRWNVLELSSFQLESIESFRAHIGVCLNVTPDHLDRHHTFEAYAAAKRRLFETQSAEDFAVLNADDATCVSYAAHTRATPVWFSLTRAVAPGAWLDIDKILFESEPLMAIRDIPLRGLHNVENAMAAAVACRLAGASVSSIAAGIRTFPGVEHRLEFVRELRGVSYYNDSKATNVDATQKALDAFPGGLWLILGGKDKGSDYSVLRPTVREKVRGVLLIGAAAEKIASEIGNAAPVHRAGTIADAVAKAAAEAQPGETVLLAPACASFDQFQNYEHRGRVFKEIVRAL